MRTTASIHKIFSSVPAVGYFANNAAFSKALADGKTSFGTAKTTAAMEAVVRNTMIQGWLSVIFVVLSIIVIATAILDRLLHHAVTLNIRGNSYRLKEKLKAGLVRAEETTSS